MVVVLEYIECIIKWHRLTLPAVRGVFIYEQAHYLTILGDGDVHALFVAAEVFYALGRHMLLLCRPSSSLPNGTRSYLVSPELSLHIRRS